MELKPSHEMFARKLIDNHGNATMAYMQTFTQAKYNSARHSASILLRNVYIKKRVFEILENNGLGIKEVAKKLSDLMNAKIYRTDHIGTRLSYDDKDTQFKALSLILRLYESLNKFEPLICLSPNEVAQINKMVEEFEVLNQKMRVNA